MPVRKGIRRANERYQANVLNAIFSRSRSHCLREGSTRSRGEYDKYAAGEFYPGSIVRT